MDSKGHALFVTSDDAELPTIFCADCGAHTSVRRHLLCSPCTGKPQRVPRSLRYGFFAMPPVHPASGRPVARPYPVSPSCPFLADIVLRAVRAREDTPQAEGDLSFVCTPGAATLLPPLAVEVLPPVGEVLSVATRFAFDDPDLPLGCEEWDI